ncbi:transcriptional regulator, SARP family protein [Acanthamoeba castellanii str. Neff]|uniref:Transcriptional regulator, SARP family protein n=1 Tax=Acanthamoeba castellanii (strain ATCC 30010 / Neff) TaxID=1257118 RepID=L8H6C2_ACACF|nr:transcriptional regulator, SARP family protein [Acanthamoeba castellanii str. Neff]ELR20016.1 transcriptional regulator, SARP family protein [Acanthamoeba castellanii str. Neff]
MVASPSSPNDFVGRERELQQITEFVDANHPRHGKPRATNLVILLYGLPVVGKSALARRLMAEFAERYPDFHFQINMKGVASASGYISLTDAMVGVIRSVHPTLTLPLDNLPAIRGIYESCFKGRQCMLLIENVGSVEQITPLLPVTSKSCLAVATSRKDLSLDIALGTETTLSVKLSAMTPGDAAQLVQSLLPHASADEARELARLCGDLPLPIRLIGGLMAMLESSLGVADEEYPPEVYDAMRSLCLFPATFDGCAATALLDKTYEEAEDILGVLLEYSLLDFDLATGRYHMNDLVRSHALHKALAADAHVVEALRERFVRYFLGQLSTCRALLVQQPGPAADDPSRGDTSSSSAAKERATLLFTRERYNFDACAKFLRQSPALGQGALALEFAETLAAVTCCLGHTAATPSLSAVAPTPTPLMAAPSAAAAAVVPRDDPAAEPKTG